MTVVYSATKMAAVHWLGTSPLFVRACVNKRIIPLNKPITWTSKQFVLNNSLNKMFLRTCICIDVNIARAAGIVRR